MDLELGVQKDRYITLLLRDMIWLHNYLIQELVKETRKRNEGQLTAQGKKALMDKKKQNPLLLRNNNLKPSSYKRFEGKVVRKVDNEQAAF